MTKQLWWGMPMIFESAGLWRRSLVSGGDGLDEPRQFLRQAFLKFRGRTEHLLGEIAGQLPQLTVHDITHIDALWTIADEIAGPDYPLNPAEAFVLGGAFLLHDAAHVTAAYPGGVIGIKQLTPWHDLIAQQFSGQEPPPGSSQERLALFQILRQLHATQAKNLASQAWRVPGSEEPIYLLEDFELREYYGELIGNIAASHHWPAHKCVSEFEHRYLSAPAFLKPAKWEVDALKVALLLRTADAAHLDNGRAPWYLFALRQPTGISEQHWKFQAKMGQICRTKKGELRLSSGSAFSRNERSAWWLAYDVANLIDRELRDAELILSNCARKQFAAKAVEHANNPEKFALNVAVDGWEPANIATKIGDVPEILRSFGGSALYGKEPLTALRELIQNAADAVHALRGLEHASNKVGEIDIHLETSNEESWLHVTDTGIGMSRYVLTNVLLDFGRSLWSDESLRLELPGLASSGFNAVGRFGIGFFSVFMLGDEVSVATRRFKKSPDDSADQWLLEFEDGLNSRPVLRAPMECELLPSSGTRVSVRLRKGVLESFYENRFKLTALQYFRQQVVRVCPTIDVSVCAKVNNGTRKTLIKPGDWIKISEKKLLERTSSSGFSPPVKLVPIQSESGEIIGRIGFGGRFCNAVVTFGGITAGKISPIGGILIGENNSDLARNSSRPAASQEAWRNWVAKWLDEVPTSSSETLSTLHPICPEKDLSVYGVMDGFISEKALAAWLKSRSSVSVLEEYPCHESHDDVSADRFTENFELADDVLVLPAGNRNFIETLGFPPIDYIKRFSDLITNLWDDYEEGEEWDVIGAVDGDEIHRHSRIYVRVE